MQQNEGLRGGGNRGSEREEYLASSSELHAPIAEATHRGVVRVLPVYRAGQRADRVQEDALIDAAVHDRDRLRAKVSEDLADPPPSGHLENITCRIDENTYRSIIDHQRPLKGFLGVASYVNRMIVAGKSASAIGEVVRADGTASHTVTAASFFSYIINTGSMIVDVKHAGENGLVLEIAYCPPGHLLGGVNLSLDEVEHANDKLLRLSVSTGEDLERSILVQFSRLGVVLVPANGRRPDGIRAGDVSSFSIEDTIPFTLTSAELYLIDRNRLTNASRRRRRR